MLRRAAAHVKAFKRIVLLDVTGRAVLIGNAVAVSGIAQGIPSNTNVVLDNIVKSYAISNRAFDSMMCGCSLG